jgi:hypothetical protein
MSFANDGVYLPIANALTLIDNDRSLFNAYSVGQLTSVIIASIPFAAFLLTTQVVMQVATSSFIR